ncbi:MAG TPA: class I SAM-dependent methyltransferase [Lacunisphaera sp.]|nr:class I SAM-dependent methyltransferase [Lacunisphaera sp.]
MQPDEYRKMAEVEDAMWYYRVLHRHVGRSLARHLSATARVLDAGCGTGGLLRHLHAARPAWRLTGLDFSPLACELARERTGGEVVQGSIAGLPFADTTFEAVTSCDVVCQVADPARAVREFHRCLSPGGVVVLTMPAYPWMYSYHDREVGNLRRYTRGEVNALLRTAGFAIVSSTYWNTLPFPLAVLRRKIIPPVAPASDVGLFPAPVEAGFNALMALEHGWLGLGGRLPFGNSVLTVARKS